MIRVEGLALSAGDFQLRDVFLHVPPGEYRVLMGPTGAGKSLLIKSICGLTRPAAGKITLAGTDVTRLEPRLRGLGYVPQGSGLFPHLRVARNVTFSLCARGLSHRAALRRSGPTIEALGLGELLHRWPETLSGGEQQKVALARALVFQPKAVLLDEPVAALDQPTQRRFCAELRTAQREFSITTIHVCHNIAEAQLVADTVSVLRDGRLIQTGPLEELRRRPADEEVARLLAADP